MSFTGSQAGIVTDTAHGQAKILEITRRPHPRRARRRASVAVVAGFQGVSTESDDHHARPRRLRHHRGRARGRARRRRVRDLHRRVGGVHRRSAHRARRAPPRSPVVRRDARDGRHRRTRARAAVGRVRTQLRRAGARAVELHVGDGHLGSRGGHEHGTSRSSPVSRTTPRRPRSRSSGCPTARASRPRCSARSPTRP